ncbi:MAG: DUF2935 domain-containing protein [Pyrinomonadaceae bacterium]
MSQGTVAKESKLKVYTRGGGKQLEQPYEKPVILPAPENKDAATHAWADARFATDIMAEHAFFFALLMPPEVAGKERAEALRFSEVFANLHQKIDANAPPERGDLNRFANDVVEQIKPLIEYKAQMADAQRSGKLRSLVWPLFFDHTQHEAERWSRRLDALAKGESEFDRAEVTKFWTNIMDEHARFVAHLLDPDEYELINTAMKTSRVFADLHTGGVAGVAAAIVHEPGTVANSLIDNPETDAVLSAAETILDFKTKTVRDVEAARIKSIIDPRLGDHVRREALKFIDELRRAV